MKHKFTALGTIIVLVATLAISCTKKNSPPYTPEIPTGPNLVLLGDTVTFTSSTYDPDGDDVAIRFSWGDGDTSAWSEYLVFYHEQVTMNHIYDNEGVYHVSAQAKDIHNVMSDWSRVHAVTVSAVELIWTFGGSSDDYGESVQQTSDGGYIVAGWTKSYGAGGSDVYLVKIDASGNLSWETTFGGDYSDEGKSLQQTTDGGYIIAGWTKSYGAGGSDVYLIKTDASGDLLWEKRFGGSYDWGFSVQRTTDGGYVIAGRNYSGEEYDAYLIKTDVSDNLLWEKTLGGNDYDGGNSVQQISDGGYIIVGETESYGASYRKDIYLVKTDADGNLLWETTFGGTGREYGESVQQTTDGGYIIVGYTDSYGAGYYDIYLIKTDASGNLLWERTFGGSDDDRGESVQQTSDGGYIIVGATKSYGAGGYDIYLIKTDLNGDLLR